MKLPEPYYEKDGITIYCADCREILPLLPKVDLVLTDPPYESEAHTAMRRTRSSVEDGTGCVALPFGAMTEDTRELFVARSLDISDGWVIAFCQAEAVAAYQRLMGDAYKRPMVWIKPDSSPQFTGDRPAMGYESIVAGFAGSKCWWNGGGKRGVFTYPCGQGNDHPTQKPVALMKELVALFSTERQTILDPFMGSGTTLVAARSLGRQAIGIEIEEKYCRIAVERLAQGVMDFAGSS